MKQPNSKVLGISFTCKLDENGCITSLQTSENPMISNCFRTQNGDLTTGHFQTFPMSIDDT